MPLMDFIDLNRSFVPIGIDAEPNVMIGQVWGRRIAGWLQWSDLLDRKRVVLLAEASGGKTEELKSAASALQRRGSTAFFFTIEQLADGKFASALRASEAATLSDWKSANEPGWFFLDSVDEARHPRTAYG